MIEVDMLAATTTRVLAACLGSVQTISFLMMKVRLVAAGVTLGDGASVDLLLRGGGGGVV